jgi:asparagine synthase (glutamine-hydrolysing)
MCGIAGRIRYDGRDLRAQVEAMTAHLHHRGPDHQAVGDLDGVAIFGHTRLSILDLSPLGNQPMESADRRYVISYNGEVYNFAEVREELVRLGHEFRGHSDTEVVLAAFVQWGAATFARFNGMFALAIWDRRERELTLARDRFGKKPLYYTDLGGGFSFCSELSAFHADPDLRDRLALSLGAINQYLAIGYVLSPLTIYQDVFKLEPASYLRFRDGRIVEQTRYWDYREHFARRTPGGEDEIAAQLYHLLDRAVARRIVSDVPVGAFLSGGIDSSGIAALAKRHLDYPLHTFTVGFQSRSYDESSDARVVASHLGTIHHEHVLRQRDGELLVDAAIDCYDEPFSDTSLVPTVELARLARRHVTVALSGDGADEIFAGYPTYRADRLRRRLDVVPVWIRRQLAALLVRAPVSNDKTGLGFRLAQFGKGVACDYQSAHYSWRELHGRDERIALLGAGHRDEIEHTDPARAFARHYQDARDLDELSQHLYVDAKTWLVDDVLVKVDRASMASSLEVRCPFLDGDLVEFVAGIPAHLKVNGRAQKYILKRMLARHLPVHTIEKKKAGFNAPINAWLHHQGDNEFRYFNRYVGARKRLWSRGGVEGNP